MSNISGNDAADFVCGEHTMDDFVSHSDSQNRTDFFKLRQLELQFKLVDKQIQLATLNNWRVSSSNVSHTPQFNLSSAHFLLSAFEGL